MRRKKTGLIMLACNVSLVLPHRVLIFRDREATCFLLLEAGARVTHGITEQLGQ